MQTPWRKPTSMSALLGICITSVCLRAACPVSAAATNPYSQNFTAFESGQVRPLAITPDKKYLLATNTPDAKLEIFAIKHDGLKPIA